MALRGDAPQGEGGYRPRPDGFAHAADLVAGLSRVAPFDISVAAYPEVHPEARSAAADLENLKRKIDAGATRAITQFFYDTDVFLRFRDRCAAAGISRPDRARHPADHALRTGAAASPSAAARAFPRGCEERFEGLEDDAETRRMIAASVAIEQVQALTQRTVSASFISTRSIAPSSPSPSAMRSACARADALRQCVLQVTA